MNLQMKKQKIEWMWLNDEFLKSWI